MSKTFWSLIALAVAGIIIAIWTQLSPPQPTVQANQTLPDWNPPFSSFIAAQGEISPTPSILPLRPAVSGQVKVVFAHAGQKIKQGQPLLTLNDEDLQSQKARLQGELEEAQTAFKAQQKLFSYYQALYQKKGDTYISAERYTSVQNGVTLAQAKVMRIQNDLDALKYQWDMRTLKAPVSGTLLHFNVQPGMWLKADETPPDEIIIAPDGPQLLHVEINQSDLWKYDVTQPAIAWLPDTPKLRLKLKFDHLDPIIQGKTLNSLRVTARNDQPVLSAYYQITSEPSFPRYVGQQFDVFIKTTSGE
jgi:multidrug efflux pump subunit AcrA (membrane-fusion protein)